MKFGPAVMVVAVMLVPCLAASSAENDLSKLCGDYSFIGPHQSWTGELENGRGSGPVLFDARGDDGRVLTLHAYGPRPGSKTSGCSAYFGRLNGDVLEVGLGPRMKVEYVFGEDVKVLRSHVRGDGTAEIVAGTLN